MSPKKFCLLTNDVETTSIWHNSLRDETGIKVYKEGMPKLLDLYEKYNIKSTFFFTGYIAKLIPEVVKMVIPNGHEVGSHGMSHERIDGFDLMTIDNQILNLKTSKKILEDITGNEVVSFRAPALRVSKNTVIALEESEYLIDSSIASQRFDMFMSFGGLKKLNWLFAPRLPYRASKKSIFKKGYSNIVEVPLSASFIPYVGTTLRIFPWISKYQRKILSLESSLIGKPIVFDVHPNEFIDESMEKREKKKRASNLFLSFFQDYLRSKLKAKNLGDSGIKLYEREINSFQKENFKFTTIKNYVNKINL
tara:strand:- start:1482 stop:2405 length:924 start_codon:yes stop_codon:yes gene_type:complete